MPTMTWHEKSLGKKNIDCGRKANKIMKTMSNKTMRDIVMNDKPKYSAQTWSNCNGWQTSKYGGNTIREATEQAYKLLYLRDRTWMAGRYTRKIRLVRNPYTFKTHWKHYDCKCSPKATTHQDGLCQKCNGLIQFGKTLEHEQYEN